MFYFVGKTGVPVQEILTSNAVSLNLKICIYIYAAHLHHIYITYKIIKNTHYEIRNMIPYDDHHCMERCAYLYF